MTRENFAKIFSLSEKHWKIAFNLHTKYMSKQYTQMASKKKRPSRNDKVERIEKVLVLIVVEQFRVSLYRIVELFMKQCRFEKYLLNILIDENAASRRIQKISKTT